MKWLVIIFVFGLSACTRPDYWVQNGKNIQQIASDLHACRVADLSPGLRPFTALEIESPCMAAKGYHLSKTPAAE